MLNNDDTKTQDDLEQEIQDEIAKMPEGPEKERIKEFKKMMEQMAKDEGLDLVKFKRRQIDTAEDGAAIYTIEDDDNKWLGIAVRNLAVVVTSLCVSATLRVPASSVSIVTMSSVNYNEQDNQRETRQGNQVHKRETGSHNRRQVLCALLSSSIWLAMTTCSKL